MDFIETLCNLPGVGKVKTEIDLDLIKFLNKNRWFIILTNL
jgi:hypothetical protein